MRSRGFTLVEVLVALLLMALMTAMAWRGLDGLLRAREITQASIDRSAVLQTALAQWEQDLASVQDSGQGVPALLFDGARLRLTRRHPQGLQVVVWALGEGEWSRWAAAPATTAASLRQAWDRSAQPMALATNRVVVLSGITDWQLHYHWDNAWANALSTGGTAAPQTIAAPQPPTAGASQPAAPRDDSAPLPRGVRLHLQFGPGSGLNGTLVRQVLLGHSA